MIASLLGDVPLFDDAEHVCPRCLGEQHRSDVLEHTVTGQPEKHWICCFCGESSLVSEWEVCI